MLNFIKHKTDGDNALIRKSLIDEVIQSDKDNCVVVIQSEEYVINLPFHVMLTALNNGECCGNCKHGVFNDMTHMCRALTNEFDRYDVEEYWQDESPCGLLFWEG